MIWKQGTDNQQPGHEYTQSNVKFAVSVLPSEAVKSLEAFAEKNKETQGKFTIGDEKVMSTTQLTPWLSRYRLTVPQKHNVFMRPQDPEIQKATGKTDPVEIMTKLREMKNNFS
jgi:hydroxyacylglutathione hydrolase